MRGNTIVDSIRERTMTILKKKGVAQKSNFKGLYCISGTEPWKHDMGKLAIALQKAVLEARKITFRDTKAANAQILEDLRTLYPRMFSKEDRTLKRELRNIRDDM